MCPPVIRIVVLEVSRFEREELFRTALASLSATRQSKILQYDFRKDRNLSLGVGLALDRLLGEYGLRERQMRYAEEVHGKPLFADKPKLHFNLSHAGRYAAGAIGAQELGIDIEEFVSPDEGLLERCCHPREAAWLLSLPESQRREAFTRIWTLKESFIKATGTGLNYPLTSLEVLCASGAPAANEQTQGCVFYEFSFPGYRGALCVAVTDGQPSVAPAELDYSAEWPVVENTSGMEALVKNIPLTKLQRG